MLPAGFEPEIPARDHQQTHALNFLATGIGNDKATYLYKQLIKFLLCVISCSALWECREDVTSFGKT